MDLLQFSESRSGDRRPQGSGAETSQARAGAQEKNPHLQEVNTAMKVLLDQREQDRRKWRR